MKKRILSLTLVLALVFSTPALAAQAATEAEAAQVLAALDIMAGDETGALNLERAITRAEFTKLAVAAAPYADTVGTTAAVAPYPDVPKDHWSAPFVQVAKEQGLVRGNLSGYLEPTRGITLVEGVTMALRLLGYQDSDFSGTWGSGQMALYATLGLNKNITLAQNDPMERGDALWLFYNLLTAKNKAGQVYLTTLGHPLTPSGEIDRVALINAAMEGPIIAEGDWQSAIPFSVSNGTVFRNGSTSKENSIQKNDVIYYNLSMRTIWAFKNHVTGAIQSLNPSVLAPNAVVLGGKTYPIETATAAYDLSDLGQFQAGDTVTLLLGRNGGVAAVRTPDEASGTVYGVVTATGKGTYQDGDGNSYTAGTVSLTATDGASYTYRWEDKNKKPEAGDLVQISQSEKGIILTKLSKTTLTGKVNANATSLGAYPFADDVEILDTYGKTTAVKVYPARLAGISFSDDMVRHYSLNGQGEITHLILNDVTGDVHGYGVLTKVSETSESIPVMGFFTSAVYVYDLGGVPGNYTSDKTIWNLKELPCQVKSDGGQVERIYNLTELKLTGMDGNKALAGNQTHTIADGAAVYELRDKTYYPTDLSRVSGGGYTLTGWYDKAERVGGRVRVIVAQAE